MRRPQCRLPMSANLDKTVTRMVSPRKMVWVQAVAVYSFLFAHIEMGKTVPPCKN